MPRHRFAAALLIAALGGACAMPAGMNTDCRWPEEAHQPLDPARPADAQHLMDDARVAEELSVRFADARWSYGGPKYDEMDACKRRMFEAVAAVHEVDDNDVTSAAGRIGDNRLDWAVHGPLAGLYVVVSAWLVTRLRVRFAEDERAAMLVMALLVSLAASLAVVMVGTIWAGIVEMLRVGNQHLSFRGTRLPWHQQYLETFVAAVATFWALVLLRLPRRRLVQPID